MPNTQNNEFEVYGFIDSKLRRGLIKGLITLLIIAVVSLLIAAHKERERHREDIRELQRIHAVDMAEARKELYKCKDLMILKIQELEDRQLVMLRELYGANIKLDQVQQQPKRKK